MCAHCKGTGRLGRGGDLGAGEGPGQGGISRGRGDAGLGLVGSTPEGPDPLAAQRLEHGAPIPDAPSITTYVRQAPETAPVMEQGTGGAGDEGSGAATWRRRVAPRLRAVVRAFFDPAGTPSPSRASDGGSGTRDPGAQPK